MLCVLWKIVVLELSTKWNGFFRWHYRPIENDLYKYCCYLQGHTMIISSICSEYSCFSLTTVVIYIVENLGSIFRIDVFHSFLLCIIYSAHQILQNHAELFEMNIFSFSKNTNSWLTPYHQKYKSSRATNDKYSILLKYQNTFRI